jgi:hypothetical protein
VTRTAYSFTDQWVLPARPERLHERLVDLERYPEWWPEVRAVASLGPDDALVVCRSRLPYDLELHLHAVHRRPDLLETTIAGDLHGWVRWRLAPVADGTRLAFEQAVDVPGRLLRLASYVARPVLVWNHHRMLDSAIRALGA